MIIQQPSLDWVFKPAWPLDRHAAEAAAQRQRQLTKPLGSLGELEVIAQRFAAWQGRVDPRLEQIAIRIFAADHGICAKAVSAYPQEVTAQMIGNFLRGGAAISVLARQLGADLQVCNMGTVTPPPDLPGLKNCAIAPGTRDFTEQAAMSHAELVRALRAGADAVPEGIQLFVGGEMGIGNTTSTAALVSALLDLPPDMTVGPGTGVDAAGLVRKRQAVESALALHGAVINAAESPALTALETIGGFEIAALAGAYIRCGQRGIGVLVDGYISTAAALCAVRINPQVRDWLMFGHASAEPAHRLVLKHLGALPLLDLRLRLGEGSGAALAIPLLQAALDLHNNMASFATAGVAGRE